MTLVKFKRPLVNGQTSNQAVPFSPFTDLLENFFAENLYAREHSSFVPAVNLSEDENQFLIELSAPGYQKENFKLEMNKNVMSISGNHEEEKQSEEKRFSRKEYTRGSFLRKFTIPEGANVEAISAQYENGILKISIPKLEEAKDKGPKEIKIS